MKVFVFIFISLFNLINAQTTTQFIITGDFETNTLADTLKCNNGNISNIPDSIHINDSCYLNHWYSTYSSDFLYSTMNEVPWNAYHSSTNNGNVHLGGTKGEPFGITYNTEGVYVEAIHTLLKNNLINNCIYSISFSALFYYSDTTKYQQYCSQLGILFTDTATRFEGSNYIYNTSPTIETPQNLFFNDTSNFVNFSSNYTANGSESYITIANFKNFNNITQDGNSINEFHLNYLGVDTSFIFFNLFLDNISILPIGYEDLTLDLGTDTNLCNGAININAYEPRFEHYLWNTGDTTPNISISQGGTYILEADYGCGKLIDSIVVAENPPDSLINATDTLFLCPNDLPFSLSASQNYNNLYWNTGDTVQSISIVSEGLYTAYLEYYCITVTDPTYVFITQNNSNLISFSDTIVCANFSYSLVDTFSNYTWSNGTTNATFTTSQSGTYWLQAKTSCFTYTDTFSVSIENLEIGSNIQTVDKCPDDFPLNLQAPFSAPTYFWSTGESTQTIVVSDIKKDTFSVSYTNVCGLAENIFYVNVLPDYLQEPITILKDSCTEKNYYVVSLQNKDSLASYVWNNEITGFSYLGENESVLLYAFTACQNFEQTIEIPNCPEQIKFALPTAFSPNLDGVNDGFGLLYIDDNFQMEYLEVYNRWGEKLFLTTDKNNFWNGKYKNQNQEIGNYIYKLKLQGIDEIYNGSLFLMR